MFHYVDSLDPIMKGAAMAEEKLKALIEAAKTVVMTDREIEEQRESFAFGNTHIENSRITKATIAAAAKKLKARGEL